MMDNYKTWVVLDSTNNVVMTGTIKNGQMIPDLKAN